LADSFYDNTTVLGCCSGSVHYAHTVSRTLVQHLAVYKFDEEGGGVHVSISVTRQGREHGVN